MNITLPALPLRLGSLASALSGLPLVAEEKRKVRRHLPNFGFLARSNCFALSVDGTRLYSAGRDETIIRVWDVASRCCVQTLSGHTDDVRALALSTDGRILYSGGKDKVIRVWETDSGRCRDVWEGHDYPVEALALAADGPLLYSMGNWFGSDHRVWDAASGRCLGAWKWTGSGNFGETVLSADGRRLYSGWWDGSIRVWDTLSGCCLGVWNGHRAVVSRLVLSPDGQYLYSGDFDGNVHVWDAVSGCCLVVWNAHKNFVASLVLSADGQRLYSQGYDGTIRVWETVSGRCIRIQSGEIISLATSANRKLMCIKNSKNFQVWDTAYDNCRENWEIRNTIIEPRSLVVHGPLLCCTNADGTISILDTSTGSFRRVHLATFGRVQIGWSAGRRMVYSMGEGGSILVWDWNAIEDGCREVWQGHTENVRSLALSPDGRRLYSGSCDRSIRVWDTADGRCLGVWEGHRDGIVALVLAADGRLLYSSSQRWSTDGFRSAIRVWDTASGRCLGVWEGHGYVKLTLALSSDGRRLYSEGSDSTIRVWGAADGSCVGVWKGHRDQIGALVLSADDRFLYSASRDKTIRVWDTAQGRSLGVWTGHTGDIYSLALSADGRRLYSTSADLTLRVWDTASGTLLATLGTVVEGGFFCNTTPDEVAPHGWFSTDRLDLVTVVEECADGTGVEVLADGDPRRLAYLADFHRPDLVASRLGDGVAYHQAIAAIRGHGQVVAEDRTRRRLTGLLAALPPAKGASGAIDAGQPPAPRSGGNR